MSDRRQNKIAVAEIFGPTIQGEGITVGIPTYFIRTGGCDFKCFWCDSLHAVLPEHAKSWEKYTAQELANHILLLTKEKPIMITLSGGNPAIHDAIGDFIDLLKPKGYRFNAETQGSVSKDWFSKLDYLTISPKPPSSGMQSHREQIQECVNKARENVIVTLKIVIFSDVDYEFAKLQAGRFPELPMYFSIGNENPPHESKEINYGDGEFKLETIVDRAEWLIKRVTNDVFWQEKNLHPNILPQVHTLLWGNTKGV